MTAFSRPQPPLLFVSKRTDRVQRLRGGGSKLAAAEDSSAPGTVIQDFDWPSAKPEPLSAAALAAALDRYSKTTVLHGLLTPDPERGGGVPVRLLSARNLISMVQAGRLPRLERRQALERDHPEVFLSDAALARVLAEVEDGRYVTRVGGQFKWVMEGSKDLGVLNPVLIDFASVVAMSHSTRAPALLLCHGSQLRCPPLLD